VKYVEYKTPALSPKTVSDCFQPIGNLLRNAPQLLDKPLALRTYLLGVTTEQMTRRTLMHLSAACKWGVTYKLIEANAFDGLYRELSKPRYKTQELANPLLRMKRDRIIEAFENHQPQGGKGYNYSYYVDFVKFCSIQGAVHRKP
jgi:hypothetical protein